MFLSAILTFKFLLFFQRFLLLNLNLSNFTRSLDILDKNSIKELFEKTGLPATLEEIGLDEEILPVTFKATKDIRDKYVLSSMCWDLGILDDMI